jgi:hydrogenase 3 maturation protease
MLNLLTAEIEELLKPDSEGVTLIITVGNPLRSDDGAGPYIAGKINCSRTDLILLNVEDKPERALDKAVAANPQKTVIIDAADFGGGIGEIKIIDAEHIPETALSTHMFPLKVIARILQEDTGSKVFFLGIQPGKTHLGQGLSGPVRDSADRIAQCLNSW